MKKPNPIQEYEKACLNLINLFCEKYFTDEEAWSNDPDFLDDDVTGMFLIGDCYLTHNTCYEYLRNDYTLEEFFERYWAEVDFLMLPEKERKDSFFPSIEKWKKYPELRNPEKK